MEEQCVDIVLSENDDVDDKDEIVSRIKHIPGTAIDKIYTYIRLCVWHIVGLNFECSRSCWRFASKECVSKIN